jgi:hypothetical protein
MEIISDVAVSFVKGDFVLQRARLAAAARWLASI